MFTNNKAQATLETVLVFIITVILVGGVVNIWFWFNNQIIARQKAYNESRVTAGTGKTAYTDTVSWNYKPTALTEDAVIPKTGTVQ